MKLLSVVFPLGFLALLTIWLCRRKPENIVSEEWRRDQLYPKGGDRW